MMRNTLAALLVTFLACGAAMAATTDVDIQNATDLGAVPGADINPPQGPAFDASTVVSGDAVYIVNDGAASQTVTADRIYVLGGGTLGVGFQSDNTTMTTSGIVINLTNGVDPQSFTIGDASGAATVNIGHNSLTGSVTVTGGALQIVDGTLNIATGAGGTASLQFAQMVFNKGVINMSGSGAALRISGGASIGDGTDSGDTAVLNATSGAAFNGGLTVARGGTLNAAEATTTIAFGGSSNQRLTIAGGTVNAGANALRLNSKAITIAAVDDGVVSTLDAGAGSISFASDAAMSVAGNFDAKNLNTAVALGSYKQTGGEVVVTGTQGFTVAEKGEISGGTFQASHTTFTGGLDVTNGASLLHGTLSFGTDASLRIGRSAFLDLSDGNLTLNGGVNTEIYGTLTIGESAGQANKLIATDNGTVVTLYSSTVIQLTEDFIDKLDGTNYLGNVIIDVGPGGQILLPDSSNTLAFDDFLYGSYTYALNADNDLALTAYTKGVDRDGTYADYLKAKPMIEDKYGPLLKKGDGFVQNIYKSAVREDATPQEPPYDRLKPSGAAGVAGSAMEASYNMNMANFQAFARGDGDTSLAGMYTGLSNSGAVDAAMSTALAVVDHVRMRQRHMGEVRTALNETIGTDSALASVILNSDRANRVWVGGFGLYEEANSNDSIPGYRYAPAGFITGYDYALECFNIGATYAYAKGSFADKSALKHDSEINSHSFGLHGSYFHPSGLFAGLMGGYTFSENDMSELRLDPSVNGTSWNKANYHTATWHGAVEVGYEYKPNACLTITPTVGFTYVQSDSRNHEELLGGVAAGRVRGVSNHAAYVPVKVEAGYEVSTGAESRIRFTVNGGYAYNFTDDPIEGTFDPFGFANAFTHNVVGRDAGHHNYNAGAGMRFVTDLFDIGVKYDYYYRSNYQAHRIMATAGFSF